ncbi:MAG: DUF86 domain-containing protein [Gemmatimonadetes bacterium]|nr:DUF86 domain-containing protein [Gemmatimonadota bacterium]
MTWLVERLAELRRHLDHLRMLEPKVEGPESLRDDLSLHNDVLFSLLTAAQLVIDIAGELGARRGLRFEAYTEAVRNLSAREELPQEPADRLARLPGFRNILIHEYVSLDYEQVVGAIRDLEPIAEFARLAAALEQQEQ